MTIEERLDALENEYKAALNKKDEEIKQLKEDLEKAKKGSQGTSEDKQADELLERIKAK